MQLLLYFSICFLFFLLITLSNLLLIYVGKENERNFLLTERALLFWLLLLCSSSSAAAVNINIPHTLLKTVVWLAFQSFVYIVVVVALNSCYTCIPEQPTTRVANSDLFHQINLSYSSFCLNTEHAVVFLLLQLSTIYLFSPIQPCFDHMLQLLNVPVFCFCY